MKGKYIKARIAGHGYKNGQTIRHNGRRYRVKMVKGDLVIAQREPLWPLAVYAIVLLLLVWLTFKPEIDGILRSGDRSQFTRYVRGVEMERNPPDVR